MSTTRTAYSASSDSAEAARAIVAGFDGSDPRAIFFFAGVNHDGAAIGRAIEARFPGAVVLGCSSNGEFCERGFGKGGAAAIALGADKIGACAVAMADTSGDVEEAIRGAAAKIASKLGSDLRDLDPERYAAVALLEGASGREERINEAMGNVAPFLPFVGGSAGDNITFAGTWTWAEGTLERGGTALFVAEMLTPFRAFKTCNFQATDRVVTVTRSTPDKRLIHEIDGEPAAEYYARLIGASPDKLDFATLFMNPLGLMIDDEPWLRSVVRREGDALFCACAVAEGSRLNLMRPAPLVEDARRAIEKTRAALGGVASGAIFFNCAFRMVEVQLEGVEAEYHAMLSSSVVHIGLHTNGESYLGHINQTLTGLVFA